MIIDIHTHTFPDKLADQFTSQLSQSAGIVHYIDGTINGLLESMAVSGVDYSVIVPIVTRPHQYKTINRAAVHVNEVYGDRGIHSFGSVHPENENYKEIIHDLKTAGIKGIKLHPVFQDVNFDDIRYMNIIDYASSLDMIVLVHGGYDLSFYPEGAQVTPERTKKVVEAVAPPKMIMAHMGAWGAWEEMLELLGEHKIKMDTSFTMTKTRDYAAKYTKEYLELHTTEQIGDLQLTERNPPTLSRELFLKMVARASAENIYYGSDSPWNLQSEEIDVIKNSGLAESEVSMILGENAKKLLELS